MLLVIREYLMCLLFRYIYFEQNKKINLPLDAEYSSLIRKKITITITNDNYTIIILCIIYFKDYFVYIDFCPLLNGVYLLAVAPELMIIFF